MTTSFVFGDPSAASGPGKKTWQAPVAEKCILCEKNVYATEKLVVDKTIFHKNCFRCNQCNRPLGVGNYASGGNGKMYCKPHFQQLFKLKGNYSDGFGAESTPVEKPSGSGSAQSTWSSAESSPENKLSKEPTPRLETVSEPLRDHLPPPVPQSFTPFPSSFNTPSATAAHSETPFPSTQQQQPEQSSQQTFYGQTESANPFPVSYNTPAATQAYEPYPTSQTFGASTEGESYYYAPPPATDYYAAPPGGGYEWNPSAYGGSDTQTGYTPSSIDQNAGAYSTQSQPWETGASSGGSYNYGALPTLSFQPPVPNPTNDFQSSQQQQPNAFPNGSGIPEVPIFKNPVFEEYVPTGPISVEANLSRKTPPATTPTGSNLTGFQQAFPTTTPAPAAAEELSSYEIPIQPPPPDWKPTPPTPQPPPPTFAPLAPPPLVNPTNPSEILIASQSLQNATVIPVPSAPPSTAAAQKKKKSVWMKLVPCV